MKKTLSILALSAVLLSACGGSSVVATVGDREILESDVESLVASEAVEGGVIPADAFADELLNVIVEIAVVQAAENEFGLAFTDVEVDGKVAEFQTQIEDSGQTVEEFLDFQGRTQDWLRRVALQQLVYDAVADELLSAEGAITDEDLQNQYDTQIYDLTDACVSHILVATEEDATTVEERLAGGEAFADVATEVSTDPGSAENGGELGCGPLSQWVPEFAQGALDAEIDQPTAPIQSQFGYHVILVTERTTTSFEEVEEDLRTQLEAFRRNSVMEDWLLETLGEADVSIVEEYGSWATNPFPQVLPPS